MAPTIRYFTSRPQPNTNAAEPSKSTDFTLAYFTIGSPERPAVLIPTCYAGTLDEELTFLWSTDEGNVPILQDYFVIVSGLLGGGESSSPSNAHQTLRGPKFRQPSYEDNVHLQYALCQALGLEHLAAFIGFSMGGQQAYHMAMLYPDFAQRIVGICTSARTSRHSWAGLDGQKTALVNSIDWCNGNYTEPPHKGLAAMSRASNPWILSPEWYRQECWKMGRFATLEDYLRDADVNGLAAFDANDLLCMLQTWQDGDISAYGPEKGNLPKALETIKAKVLLMPCRTDSQFPPEDSAEEMKHLQHGELCVIESIYGHIAGGGGGTQENTDFIKENILRFLKA